MNADIVYCKTDQGKLEIDTREHGLNPRLRRVLIMIDGQRSLAELAASLGAVEDIPEAIGALQAGGFIESVASAAALLPGVGGPVELEAAKQILADIIFKDLGADGGNLIMQLGECSTPKAALAHMTYVRNYYEKSVNSELAEALWMQARALLDAG